MSSKRDFIHASILHAAEEAQSLLDAEFARYADQAPPETALNQAGLRNGKEIVMGFLSAGEEGLALEHLIYMIRETGIVLSVEARNHIQQAASALQMDVKI